MVTRLACVQEDVVFCDPERNAARAIAHLARLAEDGVQIAVFPEAFLTGYCFSSASEVCAISASDAVFGGIQDAVDRLGMVAVIGFAEQDGSEIFNSAAILECGAAARVFRKLHLPCMGLDRFVSPGSSLEVFETRFGRLGVLICYDMRPPEATRSLALQGAEIVILPTNWPVGAETSADHICIARAAENKVFFAACNRAGRENGFEFIGRSKIISPTGWVFASLGSEAGSIVADLDLELARQKRTVLVPDEYEIDIIGCRRPELYGRLVEEANFSLG